MSPLPPSHTIISTSRTVSNALNKAESAVSSGKLLPPQPDASTEAQSMDEIDAAAMLAFLGSIRDSIDAAQAEMGEDLLACPHSEDPNAREASILLSMLAEGDHGTVETEPLPQGKEAKFDTHDWLGWLGVARVKLMHLKKHPMIRPPAIIGSFPNSGRVAIIGDWGTNLYGAPICADSIQKDKGNFDMLLHLGDVYYSGTKNEVSERFLNVWPKRGPKQLSRALNSNHEMYSGGDAYFGLTLPAFRQDASYFAMANDHWLLVGLDTAYEDHDMDEIQIQWLKDVLNHPSAKNRKVILFSHHQLFSRFESQGSKLAAGLDDILRNGRVQAWIFGHEHRCALYDPHPAFGGLVASCIGHGGMPESREKAWKLSVQKTVRTDSGHEMYWRSFSEVRDNGHVVCPVGWVLDGRNEYMPKEKEKEKFAPHGYAVLDFKGADLIEEIFSADGFLLNQRKLG